MNIDSEVTCKDISINKNIADILDLISGYYKLTKETYRAKSFGEASKIILNYNKEIISGEQLKKSVKGIGKSIALVIDEYLKTGKVKRLEELEKKCENQKTTIDWLMSFYGIGPAKAHDLYQNGIRTLEDLWIKGNLNKAQKEGVFWRNHINKKIEKEEIDIFKKILKNILTKEGIKWKIAGSYRRKEKLCGDIDILVQSNYEKKSIDMEYIVNLLKNYIVSTLAKGNTKFMGIMRLSDNHNGHRIDIRLVEKKAYPAALLYFTGSQNFNILMRQRAIALGYTLNEYGLFSVVDLNQINISSEKDIFSILNIKYIKPYLRKKDIITL